MPLKLSVRVGESIAIGGPTTVRLEAKSGQVVGLVFDADRSVPISIIKNTSSPKPRGEPVGLGRDDEARKRPASPGLART